MRLLFVNETGGPGGAEQTALNLALAMQERGHDCLIAVRGDGWVADAAETMGLRWTRTTPTAPATRYATLKGLDRLIRQHQPDVIHAHMFNAGVFAAAAAWRRNVPVICTIHGAGDIQGSRLMRRLKFSLLGHTARHVILVSRALENDILTAHPQLQHLALVIPNGVPDRMSGRGMHAPPRADVFTFGALGNIRPAKDYGVLLQAMAKLRDQGRQVRLRIAGQPDHGHLYANLRDQSATLGLTDHVEFLGHVSDVPGFLDSIDCLVSSSLSEGMPLSLIEAMLAGVPIIATRVGGVPELLEHDVHARLCPAGDAAALANEMHAAVADRATSERLAEAAAERARSEFTMEKMADRHEALYRQLCPA